MMGVAGTVKLELSVSTAAAAADDGDDDNV